MGQDTRSEAAHEYRRLYRTRRWRDVRADQLSRHPLCTMCLPRVTAASVVDHVIKDSKRTEDGFFAGPFQSLCKTHHDSTKQREERRGHVIGCDDDGVPLDPNHHWNR